MFLSVNDLCQLYRGIRSQSWCYSTYRVMKDAYGLNRPGQLLLVSQYCEYMNVPTAEVHRTLGWSVTSTGTKSAQPM